MKSDWDLLTKKLELVRFHSAAVKEVMDKFDWYSKPSIRLLAMLFERDQFAINSRLGQDYAKATCEIIPDSAIVEELHEKKETLIEIRSQRLQTNVVDGRFRVLDFREE